MSSNDFADRLRIAVAKHIGPPGTIHDLQRLTGGANKTTWSFDAEVDGARGPFILQIASTRVIDESNPIAKASPHLTAEEDARLMIAAVKAKVPAPRVRAILDPNDGLGNGYVTERVAGETLATRILREDRYASARASMATQCGEILAAIHRIPLSEVPFLKHLEPAEHVAVQRMIADYHGFRLPALELGLRWAAEHAPKKVRHTVVHGDFRAGNFIVGEEGIRCVLDWEIGQSGDPMQDLGWVCVKTWRFGGKNPVGGFGTREDLFAAYEKHSGQTVDPAHVRFWEAYGSVKWAIGCLSLGTRGIEEVDIERSAIGRRIEEPLWDYLNLIEGHD
jgi:aminoglycoside phosphotransferase (APT) family kinase protein